MLRLHMCWLARTRNYFFVAARRMPSPSPPRDRLCVPLAARRHPNCGARARLIHRHHVFSARNACISNGCCISHGCSTPRPPHTVHLHTRRRHDASHGHAEGAAAASFKADGFVPWAAGMPASEQPGRKRCAPAFQGRQTNETRGDGLDGRLHAALCSARGALVRPTGASRAWPLAALTRCLAEQQHTSWSSQHPKAPAAFSAEWGPRSAGLSTAAETSVQRRDERCRGGGDPWWCMQ